MNTALQTVKARLAEYRFTLIAITMISALSVGAPSFASGETITFDLAPFFTSLNQYLPIFIGLFAIVGGIAGAMALARYVIGAVVGAFSGSEKF